MRKRNPLKYEWYQKDFRNIVEILMKALLKQIGVCKTKGKRLLDDYSKYTFDDIRQFFKEYDKIVNDNREEENEFQKLCNRLPFFLVKYLKYMLCDQAINFLIRLIEYQILDILFIHICQRCYCQYTDYSVTKIKL